VSPFEDDRVLAILRYREPCDLGAVVVALRAGGIRSIEVTADTPGALDEVGRARGEGAPIGAGTIRSVEEARAFADAGASFLVSPGLAPEIVREGLERGVPAIPGVLSPTEITAAVAAGADVVKLFPASLGGPGYLAALRGPFPDVRFVPTGGIRVPDVPTWLEAGAVCVGLGGSLVGGSPPRTRADLDTITADARRAVELAGGAS
jgi:2-dehydro-3-deoxyphosphogluconate aldolase / (4S)-4-hydroxy-2-oxoglutarate aldolase